MDARTPPQPAHRRLLRGILLVAGLTLLSLPGCGSKTNEPNYYKVAQHMPEDEVEELLGPGVDVTAQHPGVPAGWVVKRWQDGGLTITVAFKNGKVVARRANGLKSGDDNGFGWPDGADRPSSSSEPTHPAATLRTRSVLRYAAA